MSTGFLYVFLALVLHSNSSGSVLALLGKNPLTFVEEKALVYG